MKLEGLMELLPDTATPADKELVERAYRVAKKAHKGQKRASGEPYVQHSLAVAAILLELNVPIPAVVAGLLHDTVEDTPLTLAELNRDFGKEIAFLVDGVTKLAMLQRATKRGTRIPDEKASRAELAKETLRKTFLAMGDDVRIVLVKLADRLHNMRTLSHLPEEKRKRIAEETLEIYAPLASRLGIWQMKWELEDLSFRYAMPEKYKEMAGYVAERRGDREKSLNEVRKGVEEKLIEAGIEAQVEARNKHLFSINRKMERKGVPFEEVYDVRGLRIVVPTESDCYLVLGVIHNHWRPVPGTFDDYIATPKENFYQSLHTAVIYDDGATLEVQIRTPEMHQSAELGIAAHWRYKEGHKRDQAFEERILWLRKLMEWRQDVDDATDFVDAMKSDVFDDRVYVFTPGGDIIDLPAASTPIDFAYHIHTEIGHRCRGAKINGVLRPLNHKLQTGEMVQVLTAKRGGPSRDWLNPNLEMVRTQRARSKIRQWFKRQDRELNISHGRIVLERELARLGIDEISFDEIASGMEFTNSDDMFAAIGCGDTNVGKILNHLVDRDESGIDFPEHREQERLDEPITTDEIRVVGLTGVLTHLGRCCNPAPGDPIVGYVTRGRGATIHRQDCPNILRIRDKDKERLVQVSWGQHRKTYPVAVRLNAYDRDGLMKDVSTLVSNEGINMPSVHVSTKNSLATFDLVMDITDIAQLSRVLSRLEALPNVLEARRLQPG